VKAHKEFRAKIGEEVHITLPRTACHLFDATDGQRLGAG